MEEEMKTIWTKVEPGAQAAIGFLAAYVLMVVYSVLTKNVVTGGNLVIMVLGGLVAGLIYNNRSTRTIFWCLFGSLMFGIISALAEAGGIGSLF